MNIVDGPAPPPSAMQRYYRMGKVDTAWGVRLEDMSHEELLGTLAWFARQITQLFEKIDVDLREIAESLDIDLEKDLDSAS